MKLGIVLISIFLLSCHNNFKRKDYGELLKQESVGRKYSIYSYCRNADYAFTEDICGIQIQKNNTPFIEGKGIKLVGGISKWINKDTLEIYRFKNMIGLDRTKDTLSSITYENAFGLTLKVINYDKSSGNVMNEYLFNKLKIDSKKIHFYGIKRELGPILGDSIKYPLGNIEIVSKQDTVAEICVRRIKKGMNGQYRNTDGTVTENLPQIISKSIRFYPIHKILISDIKNEVGIFYKIKKTTGNKG